MGMLSEDKLKVPCVPVTHIALNLTGPYMVSDMTRQIVEMKVWVVL